MLFQPGGGHAYSRREGVNNASSSVKNPKIGDSDEEAFGCAFRLIQSTNKAIHADGRHTVGLA